MDQVSNYRHHFKKTITLAYPVMLSQLGHVMVGVADSIMVGQLGTTPLAAASFANSILTVVMVIGIGISFGLTPLVARADGENRRDQMHKILRHGLLLCLGVGILLAGFVYLSEDLWPLLKQPGQVVSEAREYMIVVAISLIPFMVFQAFKQFAEGLSSTKPAMYITVSANILNIFLNYLLIFGKFGLPELGLYGAGIATLISRILMAIGIIVFFKKSKVFQVFAEQLHRLKPTVSLMKDILRIGIPSAMQMVFEVAAFSFSAIMMGWFNEMVLAAHQIAINLASISYMVANGIGAAATVRVGNQLGRKDFPMLRAAGNTSFIMGIMLMSISCIIFIFARYQLPIIYINDPEVIQISAGLLAIAALFQLSDGIQVVGLGVLRGLADVKIPTVITLIAYWVIGLPLGYMLSFHWGVGPKGVWLGLLIGLTVAAILLLYRFNKLSKKLMIKKA
ncbi:MAG: MATE family efflux transporter [Cyclobacteriaceae bacterium]|nr:MATE family efflux transporter [Cyclobacteriaceae bacterium]MCH8517314.1 MATE family efflux transporter [Cyclobacteriaceae bacterium]